MKKKKKKIFPEMSSVPKKKLTDAYVKPHNKKSRKVTNKDLQDVKEDAIILFMLCNTKHGIYPGGLAVAHPQIDSKDPLRFFVINTSEVVINPVITNHTRHTVDSEEGCLSFPDKKPIIVQRYNKIQVEYQTIDKDFKLTKVIKADISGKRAKVFQHEINHLDSVYIFKH